MRHIIVPLALAALVSVAATAHAGMRCGNKLIEPGDSIVAVDKACGPPDRKAALVDGYDRRVGTAYYYTSPNKRTRKVIFRGGTVVQIQELD